MNFGQFDLHSIKKSLGVFESWPIHPQWMVYRRKEKELRKIGTSCHGLVLDIGCADKIISNYLVSGQEYIGLDYYKTAMNWYGSEPHVFGDAQVLPIADSVVDTVLLLDVLEHLPRPNDCMKEIFRVIKPGGRLIVQVPFVYPIHDKPLDYQRWTEYGLQKLAEDHGYEIKEIIRFGNSFDTAALISCIAIAGMVLYSFPKKWFQFLLGTVLLVLVPVINIVSYALGVLSRDDEIMPHGYRFILEKPQ
jgi:SAM-dependent methyltransferase